MDLKRLFEIQAGLDLHIAKEHPVQEGENRLAKKILALQVELGECANEWRGFKFWSKSQQPKFKDFRATNSGIIEINPLLEEYVDCLHFILSIGLDLGFTLVKPFLIHEKVPLEMFSDLFIEISKFKVASGRENKLFYYGEILSKFFGLGKSIGFTWEQIETAYLEKNKINHERQITGY